LRISILLASAAAFLLQGCASMPTVQRQFHPQTINDNVQKSAIWQSAINSDTQAALADITIKNTGGNAVSWSGLHEMVNRADVILLGESHDSASDHAFQLAALQYMFVNFPGSVLSMEQLERNEQPWVDSYFRGEIDAKTLAINTGSTNWAGEGSWSRFYQPLIQLAQQYNAPVIAANSPRQYSKQAAREGLEALRALPAEEQYLFSLPYTVKDSSYRDAFRKTVGQHGGNTEETLIRMYAGQQVWDATMADSIVRALGSNIKVAHTVGRFHVDDPGGLIAQIHARKNDLKILVLLPDTSGSWASAREYGRESPTFPSTRNRTLAAR